MNVPYVKKNQFIESYSGAEHDKNYYFNCFINDKPTRAYVDYGCVATFIRENDANALNLRYRPSVMSIAGYGGSEITALRETNVLVKIDLAEGDAMPFIGPDAVQEVAVMIGQTFLNQPGVLMIASGETVRILPADTNLNEVLNLPAKKIALWEKRSTVIPP